MRSSTCSTMKVTADAVDVASCTLRRTRRTTPRSNSGDLGGAAAQGGGSVFLGFTQRSGSTCGGGNVFGRGSRKHSWRSRARRVLSSCFAFFACILFHCHLDRRPCGWPGPRTAAARASQGNLETTVGERVEGQQRCCRRRRRSEQRHGDRGRESSST
uniref:Uncharacterized protein n=1 Tax=Leersia perrieri TaxID=77586 RepID=A0A0D9X3I5_9ORYZ